jgi:drug/metabolite transporter (DMT)-like permease
MHQSVGGRGLDWCCWQPWRANFWGISSAVLSGIVFAMEGIIAQSCFNKISPATFTGLIFAVEWLLLMAVYFLVNATTRTAIPINSGLILMGALLSLATLSGYLCNNFGIRAIGAASTAVIGSSGPAVTAVLSLLILGDLLTGSQWAAILLVSLGVLLMNLARLQSRSLAPKP